MTERNLYRCETCQYYILTGTTTGTCMNPRLSDISADYIDSLQPAREYWPRLKFRVTSLFGCIHYLLKPQDDE